MKFQITQNIYGQIVIVATVEAKSAAAAVKQIAKGNENISKLRKFGANVYSIGRVGCYEFERTRYTVTPVIEDIAPVIMMPIGW